MTNFFKKQIFIQFLLFTIILFNQSFAQDIIGDVKFIGLANFSEDELFLWSGIRKGSPFYPQTIEQVNKNLVMKMQEQGFLYANVDSVSVKRISSKNELNLTWYIDEDLPFRVGIIKVHSDSIPVEDVYEQLEIQEDEPFSISRLENDFKFISRLFADNGYPFINLIINDVTLKRDKNHYRVDLIINAKAGKLTRISQIEIQGNNVTKKEVILRELNVEPGSIYQQEEIDKIPQLLNRLGYFKQVHQPKLVLNEDKQLALLIKLEEGNTTTFDGVIGYIPEDQSVTKSDGYFTGLLNATFRNMFGTGRRFEIFWEKPDEFSDQFKLYYEEPWVFNFPVNVGIGLERLVRDTTYIERTYFSKSSLSISNTLKAKFAISQKITIPDSIASRNLRLTRNINSSIEVGIEYDTRDYPINPRSGVLYSTYYRFGQKQNTGPSYLLSEDNLIKNEQLQTVQMDLEYYLSLWSNQLIFFHIFGAQIKSNKDQLQLTDHIWFGGARSLRGYRENSFHGTVVSWLNLEYRFLIGRNSRIFLFNDWGFYQYSGNGSKNENFLPGYGIGIRFDTALGIMGIDFGLGKDDTFSTGKIHFGIQNNF